MGCRRYRLFVCLALLAVPACSGPQPSITVEGGSVTVLNQTSRDRKNVMITVNDHYRGGMPLLKAGGRANAPLRQFATAYGQRWDSRVPVRKIDVTAENPDGTPVTLVWKAGGGTAER